MAYCINCQKQPLLSENVFFFHFMLLFFSNAKQQKMWKATKSPNATEHLGGNRCPLAESSVSDTASKGCSGQGKYSPSTSRALPVRASGSRAAALRSVLAPSASASGLLIRMSITRGSSLWIRVISKQTVFTHSVIEKNLLPGLCTLCDGL